MCFPRHIDTTLDSEPPTMTQKACTKCKAVQPFEAFYRNRSNHDGRESECIECQKKRKAFERQSKRCAACNQRKLYVDFKRRRDRKNGYDSRCKPCRKAHDKARVAAKAEELATIRRQSLFVIPLRRPTREPVVVVKKLENMSRAEREALPGYAALPPLEASDGTRLDG